MDHTNPVFSSERSCDFASCLPPAPSWASGVQRQQQTMGLSEGLGRGVPTCLQQLGRAACPGIFTQPFTLLMSVWRCVNNPIKLFTQLWQIPALGEGRPVLLCNSWAALQHAKATSSWLTRSPSSSPEGSRAGLRQ